MPRLPRILVIGAGSRGHAYASAIHARGTGLVAAVADPVAQKRESFGRAFIWGADAGTGSVDGPAAGVAGGAGGVSGAAEDGQAFPSWTDWVEWELRRRERGGCAGDGVGVDVAFVCVLDELHVRVVEDVARVGGVHVLCEKPLATDWEGCVRIYDAMKGGERVFGVGHVLRYSTHNVELYKMVKVDRVIGDVYSMEHTEPVGWWHFGHSYVRGNWRHSSTSAPTLLTKSCHDIDFLLWLLCSPLPGSSSPPHLPSSITSMGSLRHFRRARKPPGAGSATNCLSCPIESDCKHSSRKLYVDRFLRKGKMGWPVKIVVPEIEDIVTQHGLQRAEETLLDALREDYPANSDLDTIKQRPWYGRCAFECDNDVVDDQTVTISWEDDPYAEQEVNGMSTPAASAGDSHSSGPAAVDNLRGRCAKTALFHMVAFTDAVCERRGVIYGSAGEIHYDSDTITVTDFATGDRAMHHLPAPANSGHGGGDATLAVNMVCAVRAVINGEMDVQSAQMEYLGCTLEEMLRSHAVVWAAEEARREGRVVRWGEWWERNGVSGLAGRS